MIIAIRIRGIIDVPRNVEETLFRIKLRRKYAAVLVNESPENMKLLKKIRYYISYGRISEGLLERLIKIRGKPTNKKEVDAKKILAELGKKSLEELGIKPFFRLHPPRGGIESKKHAGVGKGVLGENKEIEKLVEKML